MNTYQQRDLQAWLNEGRATGAIRQKQTIRLASRMGESEAMAWIADIVTGKATESDALVFMRRAVTRTS